MKIGIDIRNIGKKRTGDEVVFFNIVKHLALLDSTENYILFTDISDQKILTEIKEALGITNKPNFQIVSLKARNKFDWNLRVLPAYLRKNPVDIYQTQYITPLFVPRKIKIATIVHDISFTKYPQFIKWSDLFFLKLFIPLSLRRANKIIGVSEFTRDEIINYYKIDPEKIDFIHNAVGDNFLKESSKEELEAVRKKYALPPKFILYIGTLQPRKNLPTLIEAYAEAIKNKDEIKLVLAGGKGHNFDPKIDNTIEKYDLKNDVLLPGYIDEKDKSAIFHLAHVFCFPSFYEGFGIPVLEAMTLGVPVLASNIPPHEEVAAGSALLFDVRNNRDMEKKLAQLCTDDNLRKDLSEKEKRQAQNFSWSKTAKKILNIYKNLE